VRVEVFSIGFGKELIGWTDKNKTRWKIALFPLGGYVKMFGERDGANPGEGDDSHTRKLSDAEKSVSFAHKPLSQRAAIVAAGPIINILFAVIVYAALFATVGKPIGQKDYFEYGIGGVVEGSAADRAGFEAGDVILSADGKAIESFAALSEFVLKSEGAPVEYVFDRSGARKTIVVAADSQEVIREDGSTQSIYRLGIRWPGMEYERLSIVSSVLEAGSYTWNITGLILSEIGNLFVGQADVKNLGGPIKIAQMSGEAGERGGLALFSFIAVLSINLGLLNLLPIPMLDGGHLLFYAVEAVIRKPIPDRIQEISLRIGLAFLLTLMFFVIGNDIINL
ncbi:MAG: RIP metalloprotease RseP, partial [Alphaproteobacteria bacterium]|nr:RIP metalloprotease RseP [Alphaproteobacteria bacterium]